MQQIVEQIEKPQQTKNEFVMGVCTHLKNFMAAMKTRATETPGAYVGYKDPSGRSAEERVYLLDPVTGLRWSVGRAFVIADPGTVKQRDVESFTITIREQISTTPLRFLTRKLWVAPFLPNQQGEMGSITSMEQVEQLEQDSTKSLVAFDTITRTAMVFKRIGKRFANGELRKELTLRNTKDVCSRELHLTEADTAAVVSAVDSLLKNGLTIHLPAVSLKEAARMGNKEKIVSLHPDASQVIMQGISEILTEMIEVERRGASEQLSRAMLIELSQLVFDTLIGKWSLYLEQEHGDFIRDKTGDFEIPPFEPSQIDKFTAGMSDRWADIAKCFKTKASSNQDISVILGGLDSLQLIPVSSSDLEVTESNDMLTEHQKYIHVARKSGRLQIV